MLLFITIGVFDVLDILIVAFILLQVYRLVKGTAAVNILAGIFTIYLAWLLMKAFDMRLISSILGQFMGVGGDCVVDCVPAGVAAFPVVARKPL